MSPINKFDTMPIDWPDPGQVQHRAPLGGSTDDGAEFGFETDAELRAANMVKALEQTVLGGGYLIVTASNAKALLDFMTNLNGAFATAVQMFKDSDAYMSRPGVTFDPLREAAPDMLRALKLVMAIYRAQSTVSPSDPPGVTRFDLPWVDVVRAAIAKADGGPCL